MFYLLNAAEKSLTKYLFNVVMFSWRNVIQRKLVIVERTPRDLILKEICWLYRSILCLNRCKGTQNSPYLQLDNESVSHHWFSRYRKKSKCEQTGKQLSFLPLDGAADCPGASHGNLFTPDQAVEGLFCIFPVRCRGVVGVFTISPGKRNWWRLTEQVIPRLELAGCL